MWKLVALEAVTFVRKNNSLTSLLYYIQITYIYIYTPKKEKDNSARQDIPLSSTTS